MMPTSWRIKIKSEAVRGGRKMGHESADERLAQIMQVINIPYYYDRTAKNSSLVSKGALQVKWQ